MSAFAGQVVSITLIAMLRLEAEPEVTSPMQELPSQSSKGNI